MKSAIEKQISAFEMRPHMILMHIPDIEHSISEAPVQELKDALGGGTDNVMKIVRRRRRRN